jgi:hypothetical protein
MDAALPNLLELFTGITGMKLPSRNTISEALQTIGRFVQRDLARELNSMENVQFALDGSQRHAKEILPIRVYYADPKDNYYPKSALLAVIDMSNSANGRFQRNVVAWLFQEFKLNPRILRIYMGDTAAVNSGGTNGAVTLTAEYFNQSISFLPCAEHVNHRPTVATLDTIAGRAPSGPHERHIDHLWNQMWTSWQYFGNGSTKVVEFLETAQQLHFELTRCQKPLPLRWLYNFRSAEWAIQYRPEIIAVCEALMQQQRPVTKTPKFKRFYALLFNASMWAQANAYVLVLRCTTLPSHNWLLSHNPTRSFLSPNLSRLHPDGRRAHEFSVYFRKWMTRVNRVEANAINMATYAVFQAETRRNALDAPVCGIVKLCVALIHRTVSSRSCRDGAACESDCQVQL